MASVLPKALIAFDYEQAAQAYLRDLPLEHFMESTTQATQREITLESLALLKARRPDVQVFNELLVQYPVPRQRKPGQVVPDNMVILDDEPLQSETSFNLPLESARPFWVLEYVSQSNPRKDYIENFVKYERHLKVPYYLVFNPERQELTLYHLTAKKYVAVKPNARDRYPIAKLDLEVGLLDGWVRYWHQGELLPLPAELQRDFERVKRQAAEADHRTDELRRQLEESRRELAQLRAQMPPSARRNPGPPLDESKQPPA